VFEGQFGEINEAPDDHAKQPEAPGQGGVRFQINLLWGDSKMEGNAGRFKKGGHRVKGDYLVRFLRRKARRFRERTGW